MVYIKLITRLHLGSIHLNEHKLNHGLNGTNKFIYICGGEFEFHHPEFGVT